MLRLVDARKWLQLINMSTHSRCHATACAADINSALEDRSQHISEVDQELQDEHVLPAWTRLTNVLPQLSSMPTSPRSAPQIPSVANLHTERRGKLTAHVECAARNSSTPAVICSPPTDSCKLGLDAVKQASSQDMKCVHRSSNLSSKSSVLSKRSSSSRSGSSNSSSSSMEVKPDSVASWHVVAGPVHHPVQSSMHEGTAEHGAVEVEHGLQRASSLSRISTEFAASSVTHNVIQSSSTKSVTWQPSSPSSIVTSNLPLSKKPANSARTLALTAREMAESGCKLSDEFVRLTVHDAIRVESETDKLTPADVARCMSLYGKLASHLANELQRGMHVALIRRLELQVLRVGLDLQAEDVMMILRGLLHADVSPTHPDVLRRLASAVRKCIKNPEPGQSPFSFDESALLLQGMMQLGYTSVNFYRHMFRHVAHRLLVLSWADNHPLGQRNLQTPSSIEFINTLPAILSVHEMFRNIPIDPPVWQPQLLQMVGTTVASHVARLSDSTLQAFHPYLPPQECSQLAVARLEAEADRVLASLKNHRSSSEEVLSLLQACAAGEAMSLQHTAETPTAPAAQSGSHVNSSGSSLLKLAGQGFQPHAAVSPLINLHSMSSNINTKQGTQDTGSFVTLRQPFGFSAGSPVHTLLVQAVSASPNPSSIQRNLRRQDALTSVATRSAGGGTSGVDQHHRISPNFSSGRISAGSSSGTGSSSWGYGASNRRQDIKAYSKRNEGSHSSDRRPDHRNHQDGWTFIDTSQARATSADLDPEKSSSRLSWTPAQITQLVTLAPMLVQPGAAALDTFDRLAVAVDKMQYLCTLEDLTTLAIGFEKFKALVPQDRRDTLFTERKSKHGVPMGFLLPTHMTGTLSKPQGHTPSLHALSQAMQAISCLGVPQQKATDLVRAVAAISMHHMDTQQSAADCAGCLVGLAQLNRLNTAFLSPNLLESLCSSLLSPQFVSGGLSTVDGSSNSISSSSSSSSSSITSSNSSSSSNEAPLPSVLPPQLAAKTLSAVAQLGCATDEILSYLASCVAQAECVSLSPFDVVLILKRLSLTGLQHTQLAQQLASHAAGSAAAYTTGQLMTAAISLSRTGALTKAQLSVLGNSMLQQLQQAGSRKYLLDPYPAVALLSVCAQLGYENPTLLQYLVQRAISKSSLTPRAGQPGRTVSMVTDQGRDNSAGQERVTETWQGQNSSKHTRGEDYSSSSSGTGDVGGFGAGFLSQEEDSSGSSSSSSSMASGWAGLRTDKMVCVVQDLVQLHFFHLPTYKQLAELLVARMESLSLPQKASLLCSFLTASRLAASASAAAELLRINPRRDAEFEVSLQNSSGINPSDVDYDPYSDAAPHTPEGHFEAEVTPSEHVLAADLQPALESLFSVVMAGGLDLYYLSVEEIASVLKDLATSGIYDEVLVRSACAASAYRLGDSSTAALVMLTAAMSSFKHPDVSYIDELAKVIQSRAETLDCDQLLELVPLFTSLPVSRQRGLLQSFSLAAVAQVPAMPAVKLVALLEAFSAVPHRHGTFYAAVAHLVTTHPGRFLPGQLLAIGQSYYSAGQHTPSLFSVLAVRMCLSAPLYEPRELQEASTLLRALGMDADAAIMAQAFVTRVQANSTLPHSNPPHA